MRIAALYVEKDGCYYGLPGIDPWDESRDARQYAGPWPVIAHPPCQRWGRFWHGSTRKPHQFKLGEDGGCFAAALASVRRWGGVLEHPADKSRLVAFQPECAAARRRLEHVMREGWLDGKLRRPEKPKPPTDPKRERQDKVLARIAAWEAKKRRAETALRKLTQQRKRYERQLAA